MVLLLFRLWQFISQAHKSIVVGMSNLFFRTQFYFLPIVCCFFHISRQVIFNITLQIFFIYCTKLLIFHFLKSFHVFRENNFLILCDVLMANSKFSLFFSMNKLIFCSNIRVVSRFAMCVREKKSCLLVFQP